MLEQSALTCSINIRRWPLQDLKFSSCKVTSNSLATRDWLCAFSRPVSIGEVHQNDLTMKSAMLIEVDSDCRHIRGLSPKGRKQGYKLRPKNFQPLNETSYLGDGLATTHDS